VKKTEYGEGQGAVAVISRGLPKTDEADSAKVT